MKQQFLIALTKFSFLSVILFVATSAQGQSLSTGVRVNIPFEFTVAGKTFEAGKYSFRPLQENDSVFRISELEGRFNLVCLTHSVQSTIPKAKPMLVFHRYGTRYFLSQIWGAGATSGRQIYRSSKERELERSLGRNPSVGKSVNNPVQVETVTIVGELQ